MVTNTETALGGGATVAAGPPPAAGAGDPAARGTAAISAIGKEKLDETMEASKKSVREQSDDEPVAGARKSAKQAPAAAGTELDGSDKAL